MSETPMPESLQEKAINSVERFLEDESLTEDLTDAQAKPLIKWVTQEAHDLTVKENLSLSELKVRLKGLKSAILLACQSATEESTGTSLIEAAKRIIEERRAKENIDVSAKPLPQEQPLEAKREEPLVSSTPITEEPASFEGVAAMMQDAARRAFEFLRTLPEYPPTEKPEPEEKA
jgi:hypothetical protein